MRFAGWHAGLAAAAAAAIAYVMSATGGAAAPGEAMTTARAPAVVTLGVSGRANATPWIAAEGRFVAVAWGASAAAAKQRDVFVSISRDGGATFAAPVQANAEAGDARLGGELPPRVVLVKSPAGAKAGADPEIVVLWTARTKVTSIKAARSRDGGRTFTAPAELQAPGAPGDRGWPALAADRAGAVHAIWLDHRGLAGGMTHDHHRSAQHDAGASAATDGVAMAQRSALYYASLPGASLPGDGLPRANRSEASRADASVPAVPAAASPSAAGAGASAAPAAERELTRGVCYCCKTALAVGRDGALLAAWRQVYAGDFRDIAFTSSRDGGRTFSAPVRVSEDHWEINGCPDDGPAMAVGPDGTVHLVWPTVLAGDEPQGALFYASSRDNGRTFTARQRIPTLGGPKPMHPQIAVDGAGRVTVAWDEVNADGARVAVVRALEADAAGRAAFGPVLTLGDKATAAQYPILASTAQGLLAVWTAGTGDASTIALQPIAPPR